MKILYIEDNPSDVDLTLRHMKKNAPHIGVNIARSQAEAFRVIKAPDFSDYDLVLTDMHLGDGDGIAILSHIRGHSFPVSVVLLTGQGDEESAVAALKAGADDYVVKKSGYLENLPKLLENALISFRENRDRQVQSLNVLYLEHNQADVDLTRRHLQKHAAHIHLDAIYSVSEFYEMLENTDRLAQYEVLLLDYRLPQENALEILKRLRLCAYSKIPVILITGKGDEEIAVNALKLGVFDYVTKNRGYLFKLPSVIENANYSLRLAREHEALIESERRYRSLFENNHVSMLLVDPESGGIVDANPAAALFYGWSREELKAKNLSEINLLTPAEIEIEMRNALNKQKGHFHFKHRRSDGSVSDVEVYSSPIEISGRRLLYSMIYDITQRIKAREEKERLQQQLIQAQKMEAFGQLAGGIAHDFNNILSSIIGFTELALEDVQKGTLIENSLKEVYTAGKRAKDLVKQILTFARRSEEEMRPIQVQKIVKEASGLLRSTIPTTIKVQDNIDSTSLVLGNATQLHQVVLNLCTNAAQAMEDSGGVLEIGLGNVDLDGQSPLAKLGLKPGSYMKLTVSDSGPGIALDIIDSIFEPYFTTKRVGEGTGMGLAMVHSIVAAHGGRVTVESKMGKGTTFSVYLPITKIQFDHQPYQEEDLPTGAEHILFVDDEPPIVKLGGQVLERLNYKMTLKTSSTEALEMFRSTPDDFDLVITDMTMPNMTGDKLAIELMKIRPDIPVILCTGYSKRISDETAKKIGIKAFAYKPLVKADLAKTVRKVLDEATSPPQIK